MIQKYGNIDVDDIRMKMDAIKQEPKERVQKYFEQLDKLFWYHVTRSQVTG
jgi:hypothetical protein